MQNLTNSQPFEITEIRGKIIKRLEFKGETLVFIFSDETFYLLKMENQAPYKFNFSAQPEAKKVTESIVKAVTVLDTEIMNNGFRRTTNTETRFLLQIDTYKGTLMYALPTQSRGMGQNGWDNGSSGSTSGRWKHADYGYRTRYRAPENDYNPFEPDNGRGQWSSDPFERAEARRQEEMNGAAEAMRNSAKTAEQTSKSFADALRNRAAQTGKSMEEMLSEELKKRMGSMGYDPWADLGFK